MVQPATAPSRDSSFGRLFAALARQRRARDPGQARAGAPRPRLPARRGPPPHRGRPGVGKTSLAKAIAASIGGIVAPHPVHPRPPPVRRHAACRCGTATANEFEFRPGGVFANIVLADEINRASPEDPVGAPRGDGGAPGHRRRAHVPPPAPVHGHRDPEPDRARGHLPAARGAARPVPHAHPDGLPQPGRRAGDPRDARAADRAGRRPRHPSPSADRRRRRRGRWSAPCTSAPELRDYVLDLVDATRRHPDLVLGASPRGSLALQRAARALAASFGRDVRDPRRREARAARGARAPRCCSRPTPSCAASRAPTCVESILGVGPGARRATGPAR